jgi:N-acetylglutamate synthase-like GNAT family acetyltransferase/8-oxo-dGTP pyrophosphatase MutT (NUDIX family)
MTYEFDEQGWNLVQKSLRQDRVHDVTMLIEGPDGRYAMMAKHSYPPGIFRSPSGGVKPGEDFTAGALREAMEETGLRCELKRFLVHITLDIGYQGEVATWDSYVFYATTPDTELAFTDHHEVREAKWANREQVLDLAIRLRATQNGGLMYRGDLTASSLWALDNPLTLREARGFDMTEIERFLADSRADVVSPDRTLAWVAEIQQFTCGWLAVTANDDCLEITGLSVDPVYRGKGLNHALVEFTCDQWKQLEKRKKFAQKHPKFLQENLWMVTPSPGYYLPLGFTIADKDQLPSSLQKRLTGPRAKWSGIKYHLYNH